MGEEIAGHWDTTLDWRHEPPFSPSGWKDTLASARMRLKLVLPTALYRSMISRPYATRCSGMSDAALTISG